MKKRIRIQKVFKICLLQKYTIVNVSIATVKIKVGGHIVKSRQYDYFFLQTQKEGKVHLICFASLVFGDLPIVDKHPEISYVHITVLMCC